MRITEGTPRGKDHRLPGIVFWVTLGVIFVVYIGFRKLSSVTSNLDGTYILEESPAHMGERGKFTIKGSVVTLFDDGGSPDMDYYMEQKGDTLRISHSQVGLSQGKERKTSNVRIWKLVDNDQVIEFSQGVVSFRFIKQ